MKIRIACVQINCTVGDIKKNGEKILKSIKQAKDTGVDIVAFPELSITGYPPEDLLLKEKFVYENIEELNNIKNNINNIIAIIGFVDKIGNNIYNASAIIYDKKIIDIYHKTFLPNYGVFDEKRYFTSGRKTPVFLLNKNKSLIPFSVSICEDIWYLDKGPIIDEVKIGSKLIFNINASPYHMGKIHEREQIVIKQAIKNKIKIAYINLIGCQDELVFDGQSFIVDETGNIIARAKPFKEDILLADIDIPEIFNTNKKEIIHIEMPSLGNKLPSPIITKKEEHLSSEQEVYEALVLGTSDYVKKNNFNKVLVGLSGGIDSSLVSTIAVDALGKDKVIGVFMPSPYTSQESREDVESLVQNLGITLYEVSISEIFKSYLSLLDVYFKNLPKDIAEENLQARIRGNILMAFSNKFGFLVLTTGNKSEMSTGYATLYGDMAGGFAVIKDVYKTLVYKLVNYRNTILQVIPKRVITKEPTAELKFNQKDSDTLPSYNILDEILKLYVEKDMDMQSIVNRNYNKETVIKVIKMVDKNEYKRRQAPPGIKITPKSFGKDRRMPITNKYKDENKEL